LTAGETPPPAFFDRDAVTVAAALIGAAVTVRGVTGRVVETEAYRRDDPASHSAMGPTRRNRAMFGPPGCAYVYRSYGIHWCLNVVCATGEAVLLRALEPLAGLELMANRRGTDRLHALCTGPGKIGQALAISPEDDGLPFGPPDFRISTPDLLPKGAIISGPRIGITRAVDLPWRFGLRGSPHLSRRF
jgi:DNA-3-methyladenine glycosylase